MKSKDQSKRCPVCLTNKIAAQMLGCPDKNNNCPIVKPREPQPALKMKDFEISNRSYNHSGFKNPGLGGRALCAGGCGCWVSLDIGEETHYCYECRNEFAETSN